MRRRIAMIAAGAALLLLVACGGGHKDEVEIGGGSSATSEESRVQEPNEAELIAVAQNGYFPNFQEKTIGEYVETATGLTKADWALENDLSDHMRKFLTEEAPGGQWDGESPLVRVDLERGGEHFGALYIEVNPETLEAKFLAFGEIQTGELAFMANKNADALSEEELENAVLEGHFDGLPDRTIGDYFLIVNDGKRSCFLERNLDVIQELWEKSDFDLEHERVIRCHGEWPMAGKPCDFNFFFAVDRVTGDVRLIKIRDFTRESGNKSWTDYYNSTHEGELMLSVAPGLLDEYAQQVK